MPGRLFDEPATVWARPARTARGQCPAEAVSLVDLWAEVVALADEMEPERKLEP
jgi:hypothetical protein